MRIDRRLLGWGALFVIAGAIPLAIRAGIIERSLVEGWPSLWPLLLVGAGLGLLLRQTPVHALGGLVTVVTAGVMVGGLLATGFGGIPTFGACGNGANATAFADRSGALSDRGSVGIEFNCGKLNVTAIDGSSWTLTGRSPLDRQPRVSEDGAGVQITAGQRNSFNIGDEGSEWNVGIPRSPMVDLDVTLNAGEGILDLTGATMDTSKLSVNAGSLKARFAAANRVRDVSATVNAGELKISLPSSVEIASLNVNAGSMTACFPSDAKLRIVWSGGLASHNMDGLGLTKLGNNEWASPGVSPTSVATDLNVSANAGSFNLVIGGSCDA